MQWTDYLMHIYNIPWCVIVPGTLEIDLKPDFQSQLGWQYHSYYLYYLHENIHINEYPDNYAIFNVT